jgi:L-cysteine desulfidase
MNTKAIIELLKAEVLPTTGCTEPGAVALATAAASEVLKGNIDNIVVRVNSNIYKNGVAVGIPGTGETGLTIAAALGAVKKHPEKQLSVLEGVTPEELAAARAMLAKELVDIRVDESKTSLYICAQLMSGANYCEVIIQNKHTNVVSIQLNGENLLSKQDEQSSLRQDYRQFLSDENVSIAQLVAAVEVLPAEEIAFLLDGVNMNVLAAKIGIEKKLGMGIGAMYEEMMVSGAVSDDLINSAKRLTAAAADARMSGENVQIMSSAGSGNHGITVILPVYAVAKKIGVSKEQLLRAVALSHLVTIYVKIYTGSLSALCGCAVAAATGATAAITWLMGGNTTMIESAMKNIIANLTGMICDGGKVGCALKLSTAAAAAVESSLLAQRNIVVPDTNGIITNSIERTIANLGKVSNPGMLETDKVILDVMMGK